MFTIDYRSKFFLNSYMLHFHKTKEFICIEWGGGGVGGGGSTFNFMFYVIGRRLTNCQF